MFLCVVSSQLVPLLWSVGVMKGKTVVSSCFWFSQNFHQEGVWKIIKNSKIPQVLASFWELSGVVGNAGVGWGGKAELLGWQNAVPSHTWERVVVDVKWFEVGEDTIHEGGHFKIWLPLSFHQAAFQFLPSPDQDDKFWRVHTLRISLKFR